MKPPNKKSAGARGITQPFKQRTGPTHQFKSAIAQLKTGVSAQSVKRPVAPPVYRPQATPKAAQPKMANGTVNWKPPVAPPIYRPQPVPKALQLKKPVPHQPFSQSGRASAPPVAPPAYRPQPVPKVLQA